MTTIEKVVLVLIVLCIVGIFWFSSKAVDAISTCNPSVITETKDGKEVTSLGCK